MEAVVWEVDDRADRVLRQRRAFRERLRRTSPATDADAAELIYGELVTNAVRYAPGEVQVRLEIDHDSVLIVRDRGPGLPELPAAHRGLLAESGRGLAIVSSLASHLQVERRPEGGTEIRAVLPRAA